MSMAGGSNIRSGLEIPTMRLMEQDMSGRGSHKGGWRPSRVVRGVYDGTLSDVVVPVRHVR